MQPAHPLNLAYNRATEKPESKQKLATPSKFSQQLNIQSQDSSRFKTTTRLLSIVGEKPEEEASRSGTIFIDRSKNDGTQVNQMELNINAVQAHFLSEADQFVFGEELPENHVFYINLYSKQYQAMPFVDMIDEGWNVTRNKMRADIANDDERFDDLMDFYQTTEE